MAVISVRLNNKEEKILEHLSDYPHEDKSNLFKKLLYEMYEDVQDIKFLDTFIKKISKRKRGFVAAANIFKEK